VRTVAAVLAVLALHACSSASTTDTCAPGSTQLCIGPTDCAGAQVCASDGTGWLACECGAADAAEAEDSSAVADARGDASLPGEAGEDSSLDASFHLDSATTAEVGADAADGSAILPATNAGSVSVLQQANIIDAGATPSKIFTAGALFSPTGVGLPGCAEVVAAGCNVITCPTAGSSEDAGPPVYVSAGSISITGGTTSLELTPSSGETYQINGSGAFFNGGETLTVQATGGAVPPFAAQVTAPSQVTVFEPIPAPDEGSLTISRDVPLSFGWSGSTAGQVVVVAASSGPTSYVNLQCAFSPTGGGGAIPVGVMQMLQAGPGAIAAFSQSQQILAADAWTVSWSARYDAVDSTGQLFEADANFQ
jgi:hypothetical protein